MFGCITIYGGDPLAIWRSSIADGLLGGLIGAAITCTVYAAFNWKEIVREFKDRKSNKTPANW